MADSSKIVSAFKTNSILSIMGLGISFGANLLLVRSIRPELFAEYAAVLGIVVITTMIAEAGGYSGFTQYLPEARKAAACGTFYRALQRRRLVISSFLPPLFMVFGPIYGAKTKFTDLVDDRILFGLIGVVVCASLFRALSHFSLLALFKNKQALLIQHVFTVLKSISAVIVCLAGGGLFHLVLSLALFALLESFTLDWHVKTEIGSEKNPLEPGFVRRSNQFGLYTFSDKAAACFGNGVMLSLALPLLGIPAAIFAHFVIGWDNANKLLSVAVTPVGGIVAPYLSNVAASKPAQSLAVGRVIKLASFIYLLAVGTGFFLFPFIIPGLFGRNYVDSGAYACFFLLWIGFETWIRFWCSPSMLRNNLFKQLFYTNLFQSLVTLVLFLMMSGKPLELMLKTIAVTRCSMFAINIYFMRTLISSTLKKFIWMALAATVLVLPFVRFPFLIPLVQFENLPGAALLVLPIVQFETAPVSVLMQMLKWGVFMACFVFLFRTVSVRDHDLRSLLFKILGARAKYIVGARAILSPKNK